MTVAFFGAGMLGSGFVRSMRKRGVEVRVYNRTAARAKALEAAGAKAFEDPAECAKGCDRIHLSLSDDAAVDDVLERARAGIAANAIIVDHTTTSPTGTRDRAARWAARKIEFVHAPVFMGPQNALDATGIMLVSGPYSTTDKVRDELSAMTGKVVELGEEVDRAAAFKLVGNLFLMFFTSGLAEAFTLAKACGVDPADVASLFNHFNPGLTIAPRIERMLKGDLSKPSWELSMARKDARIMMDEAKRADVALHMLPAIAARMDTLIAEGHGGDDWTILAKDARR